MQNRAQQRSATHAAKHTRAQEHAGSTAAHSRARPASSCMHTAHSTAQLQHNIIAVTEHAVHNCSSKLINLTSQQTKEQNRAHSTVHARTARITQGTAQERRARESTVMCGRAWPRTAPQNKHSTVPATSCQSAQDSPQHITHNTQRTTQSTTHVALSLYLECLS